MAAALVQAAAHWEIAAEDLDGAEPVVADALAEAAQAQ